MKKMTLSMAIGNYDRHRGIIDGSVQIDGVEPVIMTLSPEEMFFRAMRHEEFDIAELSLSSFTLRTARGDNPYVGIPVFPSRAFRHASIIVNVNSGIEKPQDLVGKRVGIAEWQLTANVWTRAFLQDDFGVEPADITWMRGGIEEKGRVEKLELNLSKDIHIENIKPTQTLGKMIEAGEIDAYIGPRAPLCFHPGNENLRWLFADPMKAALDYYRKSNIFPIMHLIGVKRELVKRHPWIAMALMKAFSESKRRAWELLVDTSATKVMLPFVEELVRTCQQDMGEDFWSFGIQSNAHVLRNFVEHHHAQGVSDRLVDIQELFHPASLEKFKI